MPGRSRRRQRRRRLLVVVVVVVLVATFGLLLARTVPGGPGGPGPRPHASTPGSSASVPPSTPAGPPSSTAATPAGAPTEGDVTVTDCTTGRAAVRPDSFALSCGTRPLSVSTAAWKYWGQTSAMANVVVEADACDPDCAHGSDQAYAVVLVLDRVESPAGRGPRFTRATVVWSGEQQPRGLRAPLSVDLS